MAPPQLSRESDATVVTIGELTYRFDDRTGAVAAIQALGLDLLASPLRLNFWRPPTNNDEGAKLSARLAVWRRAGEFARVTARSVQEESDGVTVRYELAIPVGRSTASVTYRVLRSGELATDVVFRPAGEALPMIPRLGFTATLPRAFAEVAWFGLGPTEKRRPLHWRLGRSVFRRHRGFGLPPLRRSAANPVSAPGSAK